MWVNLIALGLCIAWLYSRGSSKDFPTNQKTITMQHFFDNILRSPQLDYLEYDVRTNTVFVYLKRNDVSDFIRTDSMVRVLQGISKIVIIISLH